MTISEFHKPTDASEALEVGTVEGFKAFGLVEVDGVWVLRKLAPAALGGLLSEITARRDEIEDLIAGNVPEHEVDQANARFRLKTPDGEWGEWISSKGPKGDKGDPGGMTAEQAQEVADALAAAETAVAALAAVYTKTQSDLRYATFSQGMKAQTALQPAALVDYYTKALSDLRFASAAQGLLAEAAQPADVLGLKKKLSIYAADLQARKVTPVGSTDQVAKLREFYAFIETWSAVHGPIREFTRHGDILNRGSPLAGETAVSLTFEEHEAIRQEEAPCLAAAYDDKIPGNHERGYAADENQRTFKDYDRWGERRYWHIKEGNILKIGIGTEYGVTEGVISEETFDWLEALLARHQVGWIIKLILHHPPSGVHHGGATEGTLLTEANSPIDVLRGSARLAEILTKYRVHIGIYGHCHYDRWDLLQSNEVAYGSNVTTWLAGMTGITSACEGSTYDLVLTVEEQNAGSDQIVYRRFSVPDGEELVEANVTVTVPHKVQLSLTRQFDGRNQWDNRTGRLDGPLSIYENIGRKLEGGVWVVDNSPVEVLRTFAKDQHGDNVGAGAGVAWSAYGPGNRGRGVEGLRTFYDLQGALAWERLYSIETDLRSRLRLYLHDVPPVWITLTGDGTGGAIVPVVIAGQVVGGVISARGSGYTWCNATVNSVAGRGAGATGSVEVGLWQNSNDGPSTEGALLRYVPINVGDGNYPGRPTFKESRLPALDFMLGRLRLLSRDGSKFGQVYGYFDDSREQLLIRAFNGLIADGAGANFNSRVDPISPGRAQLYGTTSAGASFLGVDVQPNATGGGATKVVNQAIDYDSGWQTLAHDSYRTVTHSLGTKLLEIVTLLVRDGSGNVFEARRSHVGGYGLEIHYATTSALQICAADTGIHSYDNNSLSTSGVGIVDGEVRIMLRKIGGVA